MADVLVDSSVCVCLTDFGKKNSLNKESFENFRELTAKPKVVENFKRSCKVTRQEHSQDFFRGVQNFPNHHATPPPSHPLPKLQNLYLDSRRGCEPKEAVKSFTTYLKV